MVDYVELFINLPWTASTVTVQLVKLTCHMQYTFWAGNFSGGKIPQMESFWAYAWQPIIFRVWVLRDNVKVFLAVVLRRFLDRNLSIGGSSVF